MSMSNKSSFLITDNSVDSVKPNNLINELEKGKNGNETNNTNIRKRCPFTKEEDNLLIELVQLYGTQCKNIWYVIAGHMKGRNVRQCRERYQLFLSKNVKKKEKWTDEEDEILLSKYSILGPHWKKYEQFFIGRTSYSIKNRFKSLMKPKKIIKNISDFPKINYYYKSFMNNQSSSSQITNNNSRNTSLKIDSLITFSKDENKNQSFDLIGNIFEDGIDDSFNFTDLYFQNDTINYY